MRTREKVQRGMWSYVADEDRIPKDHPLRAMRALIDPVLRDLSPRFSQLYASNGRASIPPEYLLRALLLQLLYSVRSERMLIEQLHYNMLFRWFVGLNTDDPVWHATTFTKNRERLMQGDIARAFFDRVFAIAQARELVSDEHFTVDGTLIEAWAGQKSFRPKDDSGDGRPGPGSNPTVDFRDERRSNETHASRTDPDARLVKKARGQASHLGYHDHVLMENRNGLVAQATLTIASGRAEREAALALVDRLRNRGRITLGADKGYDVADFIAQCREREVTPHVACTSDPRRSSAIDGRTTRHPGVCLESTKAQAC
ncbi:DDE transposase [Vulcanimicrobium alpinum]|uniref:DDE transposase n=1 Tax=Vulcanimicrobium alpinum TaxID=3016050 RepID=A0AAN1XS97_UNVUL|nr:DDE transposase [Vulcanimicrobium alpinum]